VTDLTFVRRIAARPSIVFEALITPRGVAGWWGPDAGRVTVAQNDPRVGGRYRVSFRRPDGSEHVSVGEYLAIDAPHRLMMTWRWLEGGDNLGDARLEFRLRPIEGGAELTLTHARQRDQRSAQGGLERPLPAAAQRAVSELSAPLVSAAAHGAGLSTLARR
jgi:uncharacterized protein YndB with AHSA1/START domain